MPAPCQMGWGSLVIWLHTVMVYRKLRRRNVHNQPERCIRGWHHRAPTSRAWLVLSSGSSVGPFRCQAVKLSSSSPTSSPLHSLRRRGARINLPPVQAKIQLLFRDTIPNSRDGGIYAMHPKLQYSQGGLHQPQVDIVGPSNFQQPVWYVLRKRRPPPAAIADR